MTLYPVSALRAVALYAQGLDRVHPADSDPDSIHEIVKTLGWVQIDTLHVVQRSHYLVLWSRLGNYDPAALDRLLFAEGQRRLFEYWGHAASIIPLEHYRYSLPTMIRYREQPSRGWSRWLEKDANRAIVDHVRDRIRQEGPLRSADFKHEGERRGTWWDWKPSKQALEYLFAAGELMIADRVHFQRVYELTERVLPEWVDTRAPSRREAHRFSVEQAIRALGVCRPEQVAEYAYMKRGAVRPIVEHLVEDGIATAVEGVLADGSVALLVVHRNNLPLLEKAADGALMPRHTTFLSPFDSLFWAKDRDQDFWNFRQVLEAYKPAQDRIWGYFSLAILHGERLVGRFDPKLDRKTGTLQLEALHLEPEIEPDEELVTDVAQAMRGFMEFHDATELVIDRSTPDDFRMRLLELM
jgi:uncharacterized protein YcaQ